MNRFFNTSRIPDTAEHWDALAARVTARATGASTPVASATSAPMSALAWVGHSHAGWIAASLLLAAALAMVVRREEALRDEVNWFSALAPAGDLARRMVADDRPPAIAVLLIGNDGGRR